MLTSIHPLMPKTLDGPLRVIMIGRISTLHQDKENIPASYRVAEEFLKQSYHAAIESRCLGEQASGMLAERPTFLEALELISTGLWDLVIVEDLSRIHRNPKLQWAFVQECVDWNTRVICIADNIDTADENWEIMMHTAAIRHGLVVPDTRRRVRRTANHSFHKGGMVQKTRFGYRKLTKEEAASGQFGPQGLRLARLPDCTPIIHEMAAKIMRGDTYDRVAEWLREEKISTGSYATSGQWSGRLVEDLLRDPILSGTRTFRDIMYQPVFRTGKHKRSKNPDGPEQEYYQELAHLTAEEHAELLAVMDTRKGDRQFISGAESPLWNRPRSRSLWPGQHACCGICGGRMYRYGKFLRCKNSLSKGTHSCWNHVQVDYDVLRAKVLPWVLSVLNEQEGVRDVVIQCAWQEFDRIRRRQQSSEGDIDKRILELESEADNLATAIARGGNLEALLKKSVAVDAALKEARQEKDRQGQLAQEASEFVSRDDIAAHLDEALGQMVQKSFDFADLLRRLLPEFIIRPIQALDRPLMRSRAELTLRPDAWSNGTETVGGVSVTLDLFDPPQHIQHLSACVSMKDRMPTAGYDVIARELGINRMTVKRALGYRRLMEREGLSEPYREVLERPEQASRWKKRKNTKQSA